MDCPRLTRPIYDYLISHICISPYYSNCSHITPYSKVDRLHAQQRNQNHRMISQLMCFSCHIRRLTKCPNWCRTWNICFHLIFSWKMLKPNFAFWDILMLLRCLNSKEIKLQSSIRVICSWAKPEIYCHDRVD